MRVLQAASETLSTRYFHTDHLDSISVITDENGLVVERLSYDAWGKRRFANGADDPTGSITSETTRGFTGQEELSVSGLVHLNGRVYDPLLARFTSADPNVSDPMNAQGWNRYSYVGNDPLAFTDPNGFSWLSSFFHSVVNFIASNPIVRAVVQIVATVVLNVVLPGLGFVANSIGLAAAAAAGGAAIATGLSGGNLGQILRSAAIAGATAAAFFGVGDITNAAAGYEPTGDMPAHFEPTLDTPGAYAVNVAGHALVGCASSVASGGSCQSGALSAGVSAAAGPWINGSNQAASLVRNAVVGGLASVAGGGKFANGAITGAFGYMFNNLAGGLKWGMYGGMVGGTLFAVAGTETGPADILIAGFGRWLGMTVGAIVGDWATGSDVLESRKFDTNAQNEADARATNPATGKQECYYCGKELDPNPGSPDSKQYDHWWPFSKGGASTAFNAEAACQACNGPGGKWYKLPWNWK